LDGAEDEDGFGGLGEEGVDGVGVDGDFGEELLEETEETGVAGGEDGLDEGGVCTKGEQKRQGE
jgi:hypothetical protein